MRNGAIVLVAALLAVLCSNARAGEKGDAARYAFTLNGKAFSPGILSLTGDEKNPGPCDVISVGGASLVLSGPGAYAFRTTEKKEGKTFLSLDGGPETLATVEVGWTFEGKERIVIDPLSTLSADELRGLRGVLLEEWPEKAGEKLAGLNFDRCCVTVSQYAGGKEKAFPRLPAGLKYLDVDENSSDGLKDFSALKELPNLVYLRVRRLSKEQFDSGLIALARGLRHLSLAGNDVSDFGALAAFEDLRHLDLSWCEYLEDIEFTAPMKKLRVIRVVNTGLTDLLPLAALPSIESVEANQSPIFKLPEGKIPSLKMLSVMSTRLSSLAAQAFREENPQCKVLHGWVEVFLGAVEGVTRIRVRSGGTCHRDVEKEKTLFELREPAKVKEVLDNLLINEKESGFHCMCCGDPSFEFYKGDLLLATIGYHHGKSLRWPDGWPADAMLTPNSAAFFNEWLLKNGVTGPSDEAAEEQVRESALKLRYKRYQEVLGADLYAKATAAGQGRGMLSVFQSQVKDPAARASIYLKLFGVDLAYWGISAGLDETLESVLLPDVSAGDLEKAILGLLDDPLGSNGAARWIFNERQWKRLDRAALERIVPALAPVALTHPRDDNRQTVMAVLGSIGGEGALKVLKAALAGDFKAAQFGKGEAAEPGGMVSWRSEGVRAPDGCSDRAYAAVVLAKIGDTASLDAIKALLAESEGPDKEAFSKAVEELGKKK